MNLDELCACCMALPATEETVPFGPQVLVYKVMGKMFALVPASVNAGEQPSIAFKAEPHLGQMLRDTYAAVQPAWHLNKLHWNSVTIDGTVPDEEVRAWIANSYALVVRSLTRAQRDALARRPAG